MIQSNTMVMHLSVEPPSAEFLACFCENEVPPRGTPADFKHEIIIFHELVDRFSHRPRFPAAPRPNYHRCTIRHHGDSKKSTHPSPTRNFGATASRSREHFYKNAEINRRRPAHSHQATASPVPFVSFPLFTRRRGHHPDGAATARTQNIDHRKKSRCITAISRNRVPASTRSSADTSVRVVSLRVAVSSSAARLFFHLPARRLVRAQQVVHSVDVPAAHTTRDARSSHNFSPLRAHATPSRASHRSRVYKFPNFRCSVYRIYSGVTKDFSGV